MTFSSLKIFQYLQLPSLIGAKLLKLHSFIPELKLVNIKIKKKKIKKNILNQHVGLSSAFSKE